MGLGFGFGLVVASLFTIVVRAWCRRRTHRLPSAWVAGRPASMRTWLGVGVGLGEGLGLGLGVGVGVGLGLEAVRLPPWSAPPPPTSLWRL